MVKICSWELQCMTSFKFKEKECMVWTVNGYFITNIHDQMIFTPSPHNYPEIIKKRQQIPSLSKKSPFLNRININLTINPETKLKDWENPWKCSQPCPQVGSE